MAYRELQVTDIREVLRLWLLGMGFRRVATTAGLDRKTARRYIEAAARLGLERSGGPGQLSDAFIGQVAQAVLPGRVSAPGALRSACEQHREELLRWVDQGAAAPKLCVLLHRFTGVVVPERTMRRYVAEDLGRSRKPGPTVRVVDGEPGRELQLDFFDLGMVLDPDTGKKRKLYALMCTPVVSRYAFAWLTFEQTVQAVIEGLEAAWSFYGGVFAVVIPDNCKAVVTRADPLQPHVTQTFLEYAQTRGFVVDPARVRRPQDKPRVERAGQYLQRDMWLGEHFVGLHANRQQAIAWCRDRAGQRVHGTTRQRPAEDFELREKPHLLAAPAEPYDVPRWTTAKVGRDHMLRIEHALYSMPTRLIGSELRVRVDRATVKAFAGAELVKVHPRVAAGQMQIDPADLPAGKRELALRDADGLLRQAQAHGAAVGEYARQLLASPMPWSRMRFVYRLLGLCRTYGGPAVETACSLALDLDVVDVQRVARILERGLEQRPPPVAPAPTVQVVALRFARSPVEFAVMRPMPADQGVTDAAS